jgi:hypothetical protein
MARSHRSGTRTPRLYCVIGGTTIVGVIRADWSVGAGDQVGQFSIVFSAVDDPTGGAWLTGQTGPVSVQVYVSLDRNEAPVQVFDGLIDEISLDPIQRTIGVRGRDNSSLLSETAFRFSFLNQTASAIAEFIASRHGLSGNITPTSRLIGSYRTDNRSKLSLDRHSDVTSEWGLLSYLAGVERYELFFDSGVLVFAPLAALATNHVILPVEDLLDVRLEKLVWTSETVTAVAKTWNSWLAQGFSNIPVPDQNDQDTLNPGPMAATDWQVVITRPNLTGDEVSQIAARVQQTLPGSGFTVELNIPGELSLRPRDIVTVPGGWPGLDIPYRVTSIHRRFSGTAGFVQRVRGDSSLV